MRQPHRRDHAVTVRTTIDNTMDGAFSRRASTTSLREVQKDVVRKIQNASGRVVGRVMSGHGWQAESDTDTG